MSDPLGWLSEALEQLDDSGLRRTLAVRRGRQGREIQLGGERLVNFGANDYLGLAGGPELATAAKRCLAAEGWGSGASPLLSGHSPLHQALAERIADFEQVEAALVCSSGYAANLGAITALVGRGDAVFSDELNHASIIDGCRLSAARVHVYPHGDVAALRTALAAETTARRRLIVSDGLFSMGGDLAPVAELAAAAADFDAMLMIDEAHATGVFGAGGRGTCEGLHAEQGVHVRVGTLSKALGSVGGFIAGRRELIEWLTNRARPYFFSTAAPAVTAAVGIAAIDLVQQQPQRRARLLQVAAEVRAALAEMGFDTGRSRSQIVPVIIGEPDAAMRLAAELRERGLFAPAIRPPSVPPGQAMLRVSLSAAHLDDDIARLLEALRESR